MKSPLPETVPITGYEWFGSGGSLIGDAGFSGADTDTLTVLAPGEDNEDDYYCIATNDVGSTQSDSANLKTKNLVAHYEFEAIGTFEGKTTIADSAPYNGSNDGVIHGAPGLVDGVIGKAIDFDGIDDNVTVGQVGISGDVPRSIACWVKTTDLDVPNLANIFGFSSRLSGFSNGCFDFNRRSGQNRYCIHVNGWQQNIRDIVLDEWFHLAATYGGDSQIHWYINGVESSGTNGGGTSPGTRGPLITEDNVVMAKRGHHWRFFPGQIDDARVYDYDLDAVEVAELYLLGRPGENICINPPAGDVNGDCRVDIKDLAEVAEAHMDCNLVPDCKP